MSETTNHEYNVPPKGAQDWHDLLNENFEDLDEDVVIRDAESELSQYSPEDGAMFLATDTGVVYEGDGTDWTATLMLARQDESSDPSTLVLGVDGDRGLELRGPDSFVGGDGVIEYRDAETVLFGGLNDVANDVVGGVVSGGGHVRDSSSTTDLGNEVTGHWSTVGGGSGNQAGGSSTFGSRGATVSGGQENHASAEYATVSGGRDNDATGNNAVVGGGVGNVANDLAAVVGGGWSNEAGGRRATVAGGFANEATGDHATIAGGSGNEASGDYSTAVGRNAVANEDGTTVVGDSSSENVQSDGTDQFVVQAGGGVTIYTDSDTSQSVGTSIGAGEGTWSSLSASAAKSNVDPVDPTAVLDGVESLDLATWNYDGNDDVRHMGPMAEEFSAAFGLGADDESIATVDADGVALAAIQGLSSRVDEARADLTATDDRVETQRDRVDALEAEVDERDARIDELEATVEAQRAELETLRDELAAVREQLDPAE